MSSREFVLRQQIYKMKFKISLFSGDFGVCTFSSTANNVNDRPRSALPSLLHRRLRTNHTLVQNSPGVSKSNSLASMCRYLNTPCTRPPPTLLPPSSTPSVSEAAAAAAAAPAAAFLARRQLLLDLDLQLSVSDHVVRGAEVWAFQARTQRHTHERDKSGPTQHEEALF